MKSVADYALEFVRAMELGKKLKVFVSKRYLEDFFNVLAREAVSIAKQCLDLIEDPSIRRIVETLVVSTSVGSILGGVVGGIVAGPPGVKFGAVFGAGVGFVSGCVAIVLTAKQVERNGEVGLLLESES